MSQQSMGTIVGDDINTIIRDLAHEIDLHGATYVSSEHSMNRGLQIREVFNAQFCLTNPRKRVFRSACPIFNPGLAAARFLYILSGSNLLEPIAFYTDSVRRFSDDGITVPGSSYGARIFGAPLAKNQFELAAEIILARPDTKRALIMTYQPDDLARVDSRDIPCAVNMVFMPRRGVLHATVCMRANDALKLTPYNVFEFSLLHECMAARTGMQLGHYWHTATSMHIRGENIALVPELAQEHVSSDSMVEVPAFSETVRHQIVQAEASIRHGGPYSKQAAINLGHRWWAEYPSIWADMLSTLSCEAFRVHHPGSSKEKQEIVESMLREHGKDGILLGAYRQFLDQEAKPD